jgi:polyphenol oxidase
VSEPEVRVDTTLLYFDRFEGIRHGISTRHGGVSHRPYDSLNLGFSTPDDEARVAENRRRFATALDVAPDSLLTAHLTHGIDVAAFDADSPDRWPRSWLPVRAGSARFSWVFETDGVVSNVPNLTFFLTAADCTPILFWDRVHGVIGAAHAGWRGTARGISGNVIRTMTSAFGTNPADVVVGIGPSMGPCCYTVGHEVVDTFSESGIDPVLVVELGARRLDLWESNRRQLMDSGVRSDSIEIMGLCTGCHVSDFFSHRAEAGRTGRMACAIGRG